MTQPPLETLRQKRGTISVRCSRCGEENVQGSAFCRHCGRKLPSAAPTKNTKTNASDAGKKPAKEKSGRRRVRWGRISLLSVLAVILIGLAFGTVETVKAYRTMPSVSNLVALSTTGQDSVIYDRFGKPVTKLHLSTNRINVPLSKISPSMQHALVSIEDHNFYVNDGFDIRSIFRAALSDVLHHGRLQGASTLTEQLGKIMYLHDNRSISYKIQEILIGLELARSYSKSQILDMYLNQVYLGDGASGVATAAKAYFDEAPDKLTVAQSALLAGLPQAPSYYDPLTNLKVAKARQLQVLNAMVKYGYLTKAQATAAYHAPLHLSPTHVGASNASSQYPYPWYIDQVITTLEAKGYSQQEIYDGGLKIYTELDPTVYNIAQTAVDHWMNYNFGGSKRADPHHQAAVTVEDPHTGAIWAVIGGRTHNRLYPEDLATSSQAQRSTGSSIKPLVDYTPALTKGYTQMSVIQDVPIHKLNGLWWPQNDDHQYRGYMTLRDGLAISDNNVAVHLLGDIGPSYGLNFADQKFGLKLPSSDATQLELAIGGFKHGGANVYQMTQAYSTFPNNGVRMAPIWVSKVVDQAGGVIYQKAPKGQTEFSAQVSYIMTQMMERVLDPNPIPTGGPTVYSTGTQLGIGRPAAGKTGTNNGQTDAWFMGYEPQMVVGVWEGDRTTEIQPQENTPQGPAYGATAAGPIWKQIMEQVNQAEHLPVEQFAQPSGLVYVPNVSITSGKIASSAAPSNEIQGAWFIQGTQPTSVGKTHEKLKVTASKPKELWQPGCGPSVTSVFLKPESDWHPGVPLPADSSLWAPTKKCTPSVAPTSSSTSAPTTTSSSSTSTSTPPSSSTSSPPPPSTPSTPPSTISAP